jgi:hypothetical protein
MPPGEQNRDTGKYNTSGNGRIGGHVEKCPANIDVLFMTLLKQKCGCRIHRNSAQGHPDNRPTLHFTWFSETPDSFPGYPARSHKKEYGVRQGSENRRTFHPVGATLCRRSLPEMDCAPRQQQSQDVAKVMTSIGQKRERMGQNAEDSLNAHVGNVQNGSYRKDPAKLAGQMDVGVPRGLMMVVIRPSVISRTRPHFHLQSLSQKPDSLQPRILTVSDYDLGLN